MSKPELNIDWYLREQSAWEVSSFDVVQTKAYQDWAMKNLKGMKTKHVENLHHNDSTNFHFSFSRPHRKTLDKCLYELGLDLNENIEFQVCMHKTFGGYIVYGERFVGEQRTDKEWKDFVKSIKKQK